MATKPVDDSIQNELTNDEVIANFPRNAQGQVVIDENGQIVGLDSTLQPTEAVAESTPAATTDETTNPTDQA